MIYLGCTVTCLEQSGFPHRLKSLIKSSIRELVLKLLKVLNLGPGLEIKS